MLDTRLLIENWNGTSWRFTKRWRPKCGDLLRVACLILQTKFTYMSKTEILQQLPKLNPIELREIRDRIWQLEEQELLSGRAHPTDEEKALLDREFEDFARDPASGSSWKEVKARLNS
jgi:hypothetical protein